MNIYDLRNYETLNAKLTYLLVKNGFIKDVLTSKGRKYERNKKNFFKKYSKYHDFNWKDFCENINYESTINEFASDSYIVLM